MLGGHEDACRLRRTWHNLNFGCTVSFRRFHTVEVLSNYHQPVAEHELSARIVKYEVPWVR